MAPFPSALSRLLCHQQGDLLPSMHTAVSPPQAARPMELCTRRGDSDGSRGGFLGGPCSTALREISRRGTRLQLADGSQPREGQLGPPNLPVRLK